MWFVLWVGVTACGLYLSPSAQGHGTHQQLGLPPCPSALFLDRPCPGCGLTTSWSALLHGNLGLSFHAHPLGPVLYLLFTAIAWTGLYGWIKKLRVRSEQPWFATWSTALAAVFLGFGLIRAIVTPHYATQTERWYRGISSIR